MGAVSLHAISRMDYRDALADLCKKLHDERGLTRYQLALRSGVSEQTISNVLLKKKNLSAQALERILGGVGYEVRFERDQAATTSM